MCFRVNSLRYQNVYSILFLGFFFRKWYKNKLFDYYNSRCTLRCETQSIYERVSRWSLIIFFCFSYVDFPFDHQLSPRLCNLIEHRPICSLLSAAVPWRIYELALLVALGLRLLMSNIYKMLLVWFSSNKISNSKM